MTKCPHCTQGYVQDAGFSLCNHCQGTGKTPSDAATCSLSARLAQAEDLLRRYHATVVATLTAADNVYPENIQKASREVIDFLENDQILPPKEKL